MNTLAERLFNLERPGYWAVQFRLEPASDVSRRYLCHAASYHEVCEMVGHLTGSSAKVRGYRLAWIDEQTLEANGQHLPIRGASKAVSDPGEWMQLLADSERSETAQRKQHDNWVPNAVAS